MLDQDLQLIEGSDLVVDLEAVMKGKGYKKKHYIDFRLYTFGEHIYLTINGPPVHMVELRLSNTKMMNHKNDKYMKLAQEQEWINLPHMFSDDTKETTTTKKTTKEDRWLQVYLPDIR